LGQRQRRPYEHNEESEWIQLKRFFVRQTKAACGRSRDVVEGSWRKRGRDARLRHDIDLSRRWYVAPISCSRVAVDPENAADRCGRAAAPRQDAAAD